MVNTYIHPASQIDVAAQSLRFVDLSGLFGLRIDDVPVVAAVETQLETEQLKQGGVIPTILRYRLRQSATEVAA